MQDFEEMQRQAYPILLRLIIRLIDSQSGKGIVAGEQWRNEAQALGIKLVRHAASVKQLADGVTIVLEEEGQLNHVDLSSIMVISRAALETHLVWHYLYACPPSWVNSDI